MKEFVALTEERIVKLQEIIKKEEAALSNVPEGIVNVAKTGNRTQFYYKRTSSDRQRKYLKNSEKQLITKLCQKEYDQKVLTAAREELTQLQRMKRNYPKYTYEEIYEHLNVARKEMIKPVTISDVDFTKAWECMEYQRKGFQENMPEYYTDKGERVRSKTEILIANALNKYNIPYRYECPLYLNGFGWIHPDFTVLNVRHRKEYFWEHMGKMDNPEYIENALRRIDMYEKNDIFPGDKLILTHETLKYPINSRNIEKVILKYFV